MIVDEICETTSMSAAWMAIFREWAELYGARLPHDIAANVWSEYANQGITTSSVAHMVLRVRELSRANPQAIPLETPPENPDAVFHDV